ncbi:DUF6768 family protein [Vitreimonas flagellata]|uniref:DUF6768 family protein n=1 Tax=Vitreimonas flagellata TaxID=2560861 RepID=UPI0010756178|nr:DUF6768 family protein [Vitreimonas flagellata]
MTNLDQAIRQALSAEDAAFLARFENETPFGEVLGTFRGQWGALNVFAAIVTFALFGVFVWCAWNAFSVADLRDVVLWVGGALLSMLGVAMLKIYFWMDMHKNMILREVKRLELQVARLSARDAV